jgi:hypothetical protein
MIDIPEERILKEITDILMNDLPKVLLELEEQSEDSIRLPPFRYVGLEENLPPGTGLPYAFVEIEEGEYTEKDRIVKNVRFRVNIREKVADKRCMFWYCRGVLRVFEKKNITSGRISVKKWDNEGKITVRIIPAE